MLLSVFRFLCGGNHITMFFLSHSLRRIWNGESCSLPCAAAHSRGAILAARQQKFCWRALLHALDAVLPSRSLRDAVRSPEFSSFFSHRWCIRCNVLWTFHPGGAPE